MLRNLGCDVEFAENGHQGFAVFRPEKYDVVLMDVRMPVMDGLEATAAIRRLERDSGPGRRTPVLALTAHAMEGDRQLCLDAGMDGYLAKPVKHRHLLEQLARLSGRAARVVEPVRDRPVSVAAELRPDRLDALAGGDAAFLRELLAAFLKGAGGGISALEGVPDPLRFAAAAHALRGSALTIGRMAWPSRRRARSPRRPAAGRRSRHPPRLAARVAATPSTTFAPPSNGTRRSTSARAFPRRLMFSRPAARPATARIFRACGRRRRTSGCRR